MCKSTKYRWNNRKKYQINVFGRRIKRQEEK